MEERYQLLKNQLNSTISLEMLVQLVNVIRCLPVETRRDFKRPSSRTEPITVNKINSNGGLESEREKEKILGIVRLRHLYNL